MSERVYDHWALDNHDYEHRGEREVGFIPRPRRFLSAQRLIERAAAIDREIGYSFAWFFLMTHGFWVDPDVGQAIATGLSEQRVLPERDAPPCCAGTRPDTILSARAGEAGQALTR